MHHLLHHIGTKIRITPRSVMETCVSVRARPAGLPRNRPVENATLHAPTEGEVKERACAIEMIGVEWRENKSTDQ
jgi:hypothetical protein